MRDKILKKANLFFSLAKSLSKTHKLYVVLALHEYFRNLYLIDPFISNYKNQNKLKQPYKKINQSLDSCIEYLNCTKKFGYYKNYEIIKKKIKTGELFGKLWIERYKKNELNSLKVLKNLYKSEKNHLKSLKNKVILDMGCGSGRFSFALAKLGAKKVIGVDLGKSGIKTANQYKKKNKIKNVYFKCASVLKLPYRNSYFDYIFCKGVLHHTGNLKKGLEEFYRVLKKGGGGFLYLYGSGGLYWNSRKKMRNIMKDIDFDFCKSVLNLINLPARRTIFLDCWYVEVEDHVKKSSLEAWFRKKNLKFKKLSKTKSTQLEYYEKFKNFNLLYGNGEHRYFLEKN